MGNRSSSAANDWDSDEGGGSDYEHAYDFHTSVLHKSPADGFESDYEEDEEEEDGGRSGSRQGLPFSNSKMAAAPSSIKVTADGDGKDKSQVTAVGTENKRASCESDPVCREGGDGPFASVSGTAGSSGRQSDRANSSPELLDTGFKPRTRNQKAAFEENWQTSTTACSVERQKTVTTQHGRSENTVMEEEAYETAEEGAREVDEGGSVSDDGSLSTITPPRTRPQSESEYSHSMSSEFETGEGEEDAEEETDEEEEASASDSSEAAMVGNAHTRSSRSSPAALQQKRAAPLKVFPHCSPQQAASRSPPAPQQQPGHRQEVSQDSYHQMRKRPASVRCDVPSKRSKPSRGINFSPDRTRYGIFDTESESDTAKCQDRKTRRTATPSTPLPQRNLRETRSLSTRTLRQAAKKAASQFVETSRKILRDAKTAALILKESTSLKRRISLVDQEGATGGARKSPLKRDTRSSRTAAQLRREDRMSQTPAMQRETVGSPTTRSRRGAVKRKVEDEVAAQGRHPQRAEDSSDLEMEDATRNNHQLNSRQVRKDGGRLRKLTRSATGPSPSHSARRFLHSQSSQLSNARRNSLPLMSAAGGAAKMEVNATPPGVSDSSAGKSNSKTSAATTSPFHNVSLVPSSARLNTSTGSRDSISAELHPGVSHGHLPDTPSPFTSLDVSARMETPTPLTFTSGCVWSRISTRRSQQSSREMGIASGGQLPSVPGTSGPRMATRSSPETASLTVAPSAYPARSTPRVPSPTLMGQFAQSGCFTFLLEDVLQVMVATGNITSATTSSIVISTDSHLCHKNPVAESVAKAAGTGFTRACQEFLRHNHSGLQVCEILDTPAGGQLSPLISHVLHVVVVERKTQSDGDVSKHKKLLLCAYLNCLKRASDKLRVPSITFPLIGSDSYSTDECIQVFFDSLLVYLAERAPTCSLRAIHLIVANPATGRFVAQVLEARLEAMKMSGIDAAMGTVFRDYFNIPDFSRNLPLFSASQPAVRDRSPSGKPAVKRRRL